MEHYTQSLLYELELTSRILREAGRSLFEKEGFPITPDEFIILDYLYMDPNIIQMELAKQILKGRAHTGKFLKSLEEKKLITRTPVIQESKLVMKLTITPEGLKLYKQICDCTDKFVQEANARISVDIAGLITALKTIREDAVKKFDIKFD